MIRKGDRVVLTYCHQLDGQVLQRLRDGMCRVNWCDGEVKREPIAVLVPMRSDDERWKDWDA